MHLEVTETPLGRTVVEFCPSLPEMVGVILDGEGPFSSTLAYPGLNP
jgi:hypothetical protein